MLQESDLKAMENKIQSMKKSAEDLKLMVNGCPALEKNTSRILASIKMLEINLSDFLNL